MGRGVRVLLIAAALGLALPTVQVQPAAALIVEQIVCPPGSFGGNDGRPDCLIYEAAEDEQLSMGSVWRPDPTGAPNIWRVRFYVNRVRMEREVKCGAIGIPHGFTAKIGTFEGTRGVVGHCWSRETNGQIPTTRKR
jgi:hypothetical protein